MNITKPQFVKIIGSLMEQQKKDDRISKALDVVVEDGDNHLLVFQTPLVTDVVEALDYDGIISWWFWDGPKCGVNAEDFKILVGDSDSAELKEYIIYTPEDLYDYMELEQTRG